MPPPNSMTSSAPRALRAVQHRGKQRHVRARHDRQADGVDRLLHRRGRDHLGRLVQAGVDDLVPGVGQRTGDHLGAPVVAVEPGLADQDAQLASRGGCRPSGRRLAGGCSRPRATWRRAFSRRHECGVVAACSRATHGAMKRSLPPEVRQNVTGSAAPCPPGRIRVENPATGALVRRGSGGHAGRREAAVARARQAQPAWAALSVRARGRGPARLAGAHPARRGADRHASSPRTASPATRRRRSRCSTPAS